MPPGRYVQWVLDKAQEERDRAIACLDADVAVSAVAIVRSEAGFKQKDRVVRRGGSLFLWPPRSSSHTQHSTKQWTPRTSRP